MNPAQRALWYIESHLADPLTLGDVARIGGVSRFHMVRARRLTEAARHDVNFDSATGNGGFEIWVPVRE